MKRFEYIDNTKIIMEINNERYEVEFASAKIDVEPSQEYPGPKSVFQVKFPKFFLEGDIKKIKRLS